jgi:hypothetical protein
MNFGSDARPLGRYIVDIDGSLRSTDAACVSPADLIALHGGARFGSILVWERNGETIQLGASDLVELDETMVFFFRTQPKRRLHRPMLSDSPLARAHAAAARSAFPIAA